MIIESDMLKAIETWGGGISIKPDKYDYWYGTIGDKRRKQAIHLGPAETREELIRHGYIKLSQKMWKEINFMMWLKAKIGNNDGLG